MKRSDSHRSNSPNTVTSPVILEKESSSLGAEQLAAREELEKFFGDKLAMPVELYGSEKDRRIKEGVTEGSIGYKDGSTYMLKSASLNTTDSRDFSDREQLINEYVLSDLYKRILYDRSPTIGLATDPKNSTLHLKSKYIDRFEPISGYTSSQPTYIELLDIDKANPRENEIAIGFRDKILYWKVNGNDAKPFIFNEEEHAEIQDFLYKAKFRNFEELIPRHLQTLFEDGQFKQSVELIQEEKARNNQIIGFEKAMSAVLFLGEADYHGENIGIAKDINSPDKMVTKIDHGRSSYWGYKSESQLIKSFKKSQDLYGYQELPFNADVLKDSVDQINKISEHEIYKLVSNRIDHLKNLGFKANPLRQNDVGEYVELGHHIRLNSDLSASPLEENEFAFNLVDGKLICQAQNKEPIIIEKLSDGAGLICIINGQEKEVTNLTIQAFDSLCKEMSSKTEIISLNNSASISAKEAILDFASEDKYIENENDLRYKNLENFYLSNLKKQKEIFKDLGETLDIISKIDDVDQWKKKQWLNDIYTLAGKQDPIIWAKKNGKTIEGKDPLIWKEERDRKNAAATKIQKLGKEFMKKQKAVKINLIEEESLSTISSYSTVTIHHASARESRQR